MARRGSRRAFAAAVSAAVYFLANGLFPYAAEANLWADRRRAAAPVREDAGPMAALSSSADPLTVLKGLPAASAGALSPSALERLKAGVPAAVLDRYMDLIRAVPQAQGSVRRIRLPSKGAPSAAVLFLQDVHNNDEAQRNLAGIVRSVAASGKASLVGLEAAFAPLDLGAYRAFEDQEAVRIAADYLLKEHQITGPVHTAYTCPGNLPPFIGVDDPVHYEANVEAYRRSVPAAAEARYRAAVQDHRLAEEKRRAFNPALLALDQAVTDYHRERIPFGDYVRTLAPSGEGDLGRFLQALAMEKSLDFPTVEKERSRLIEDLVGRLPASQTDRLLKFSVAYRAGDLTHTDYYRAIAALCRENGVDLARYPGMDRYVRYVLLSGAIDADGLFSEVRAAEAAAYARLAVTEEEKRLVAASRRLALTVKLLDFSLTPDEWAEYRSSSEGRGEGDIDLSSFESFYVEADARNHAMTENLLKAMAERKASAAALVAGGFHAAGMTKLLTDRGLAVIEAVPRLTKADGSASAYLDVFTQEKTPLEQIFKGNKLFVSDLANKAGEKSFLAAAVVTGVAVIRAKSAEKAAAFFTRLTNGGRLAAARLRGDDSVRLRVNTTAGAADVTVLLQDGAVRRVVQALVTGVRALALKLASAGVAQEALFFSVLSASAALATGGASSRLGALTFGVVMASLTIFLGRRLSAFLKRFSMPVLVTPAGLSFPGLMMAAQDDEEGSGGGGAGTPSAGGAASFWDLKLPHHDVRSRLVEFLTEYRLAHPATFRGLRIFYGYGKTMSVVFQYQGGNVNLPMLHVDPPETASMKEAGEAIMASDGLWGHVYKSNQAAFWEAFKARFNVPVATGDVGVQTLQDLYSPNPEAQARAVETYSEKGGAEDIPALVDACAHSDAYDKNFRRRNLALIELLGMKGDLRAVPALLKKTRYFRQSSNPDEDEVAAKNALEKIARRLLWEPRTPGSAGAAAIAGLNPVSIDAPRWAELLSLSAEDARKLKAVVYGEYGVRGERARSEALPGEAAARILNGIAGNALHEIFYTGKEGRTSLSVRYYDDNSEEAGEVDVDGPPEVSLVTLARAVSQKAAERGKHAVQPIFEAEFGPLDGSEEEALREHQDRWRETLTSKGFFQWVTDEFRDELGISVEYVPADGAVETAAVYDPEAAKFSVVGPIELSRERMVHALLGAKGLPEERKHQLIKKFIDAYPHLDIGPSPVSDGNLPNALLPDVGAHPNPFLEELDNAEKWGLKPSTSKEIRDAEIIAAWKSGRELSEKVGKDPKSKDYIGLWRRLRVWDQYVRKAAVVGLGRAYREEVLADPGFDVSEVRGLDGGEENEAIAVAAIATVYYEKYRKAPSFLEKLIGIAGAPRNVDRHSEASAYIHDLSQAAAVRVLGVIFPEKIMADPGFDISLLDEVFWNGDLLVSDAAKEALTKVARTFFEVVMNDREAVVSRLESALRFDRKEMDAETMRRMESSATDEKALRSVETSLFAGPDSSSRRSRLRGLLMARYARRIAEGKMSLRQLTARMLRSEPPSGGAAGGWINTLLPFIVGAGTLLGGSWRVLSRGGGIKEIARLALGDFSVLSGGREAGLSLPTILAGMPPPVEMSDRAMLLAFLGAALIAAGVKVLFFSRPPDPSRLLEGVDKLQKDVERERAPLKALLGRSLDGGGFKRVRRLEDLHALILDVMVLLATSDNVWLAGHARELGRIVSALGKVPRDPERGREEVRDLSRKVEELRADERNEGEANPHHGQVTVPAGGTLGQALALDPRFRLMTSTRERYMFVRMPGGEKVKDLAAVLSRERPVTIKFVKRIGGSSDDKRPPASEGAPGASDSARERLIAAAEDLLAVGKKRLADRQGNSDARTAMEVAQDILTGRLDLSGNEDPAIRAIRRARVSLRDGRDGVLADFREALTWEPPTLLEKHGILSGAETVEAVSAAPDIADDWTTPKGKPVSGTLTVRSPGTLRRTARLAGMDPENYFFFPDEEGKFLMKGGEALEPGDKVHFAAMIGGGSSRPPFRRPRPARSGSLRAESPLTEPPVFARLQLSERLVHGDEWMEALVLYQKPLAWEGLERVVRAAYPELRGDLRAFWKARPEEAPRLIFLFRSKEGKSSAGAALAFTGPDGARRFVDFNPEVDETFYAEWFALSNRYGGMAVRPRPGGEVRPLPFEHTATLSRDFKFVIQVPEKRADPRRGSGRRFFPRGGPLKILIPFAGASLWAAALSAQTLGGGSGAPFIPGSFPLGDAIHAFLTAIGEPVLFLGVVGIIVILLSRWLRGSPFPGFEERFWDGKDQLIGGGSLGRISVGSFGTLEELLGRLDDSPIVNPKKYAFTVQRKWEKKRRPLWLRDVVYPGDVVHYTFLARARVWVNLVPFIIGGGATAWASAAMAMVPGAAGEHAVSAGQAFGWKPLFVLGALAAAVLAVYWKNVVSFLMDKARGRRLLSGGAAAAALDDVMAGRSVTAGRLLALGATPRSVGLMRADGRTGEPVFADTPLDPARMIALLSAHAAWYGRHPGFRKAFPDLYRASVGAGRSDPVEAVLAAATRAVEKGLAWLTLEETAALEAKDYQVTGNIVRTPEEAAALMPNLVRLHKEGDHAVFALPAGALGLKEVVLALLKENGLGELPVRFEFMALPMKEGDAPFRDSSFEAPMGRDLKAWNLRKGNTRLIMNRPKDMPRINDLEPGSLFDEFQAVMAYYSPGEYRASRAVEGLSRLIRLVAEMA